MARNDDKTLELIREVQKQKEEIQKAEKPNWRTNCSFSFTETGSASVNIHAESNIRTLIGIAACLQEKEKSYSEAVKFLKVDSAPPFSWSGFSVSDWIQDIKSRIDRIQIASKKAKLETLEARLNVIISPELRAEMELEAITKELA